MARLAAPAGPVEVVVKQFRNPRLRDRLRNRRREGFGGKAARSWRTARAFQDAGIATPEPVLLAESEDPAGPSFYVCRYLPGALEARYLFRAANAGREREEFPQVDFPRFLAELARTARRLHDAGFWFRDLSGGNILLADGEIHLVDLNRVRAVGRLSTSQRTRDLCRMAVFRPEHRRLLLASYWHDQASAGRRGLYLLYHRSFLARNRLKDRVKGGTRRVKGLFRPRVPHAHIPEAPKGAAARDLVVWDRLSDQPHHHAGSLAKLGVRLADAGAHLEEGAAIAAALPRIWRRYRELRGGLHCAPVDFRGIGVAVRPWPDDPAAVPDLVAELGVRHVLLRLHPWDEDHDAEEELARALAGQGVELSFALPQNRDLVRDPARWRAAVEEIAARFTRYGRHFQVGQAINRSKWGVWTVQEYVDLALAAAEVLRRHPGVEVLGPAVIDFEYHVTAAVLNLKRPGLRFDAVSSLLYVDRRGAPENRQAGLDTAGKVVLLKAIADTARNAAGRCWLTEVNWPLKEGPHSPAGRAVAVDEEAQADYLARYYLLALGTGLVERVFWWQLVARGYGLVDPGDGALRRRPAFLALQALARLEGSRLTRVLPAAPPAHLYLFRRPDGSEVAAGWSAAGTARAVLEGTEVGLTPSVRYFDLP